MVTGFLAAAFFGAGFFAATGFAGGMTMPGMCPACWAEAMPGLASKAEAKAAVTTEVVTNHAPNMVGRGRDAGAP